jgi:hypothetical protein
MAQTCCCGQLGFLLIVTLSSFLFVDKAEVKQLPTVATRTRELSRQPVCSPVSLIPFIKSQSIIENSATVPATAVKGATSAT